MDSKKSWHFDMEQRVYGERENTGDKTMGFSGDESCRIVALDLLWVSEGTSYDYRTYQVWDGHIPWL